MKLALYKHLIHEWVNPIGHGDPENDPELVRVSEFIDVDFPELSREVLNDLHIQAFKRLKQKLEADIKAFGIDSAISKLENNEE